MSELFTILKPWLPSIIGLIFFLLVRFIYFKVAANFLHRINDKLNLQLMEDALQACEQPLNFILIILGIYAFTITAPINAPRLLYFVEHLLRSSIIFTIFWSFYNLSYTTHSVMLLLLQRAGLNTEPTVVNILSTAAHIFLVILGFVAIAKEWNYDITGFIASLSIGSVAIAFAAKDTLANVFGSLVIILDKPFVIGDWISANGIEGIVEKVSFRSTCIRTFPQELVYIPNSLLSNTPIINYNKREKRRIDFTLNFTYSTTKEQMAKVMQEITDFLKSKPFVFADTVTVNFLNYGASSLDVRVICYTSVVSFNDYNEKMTEINLGLLGIFKEVGVSCAFPSTSVYFENTLQTKA